MAYSDPGGDGVGGWLSLFVVVVGVLSPLRVLVSLIEMYRDPGIHTIDPGLWTQIQLLQWSVGLLTVAACWYIVWRLFSRQYWTTVKITIVLIWVISVGGLAVQLLGLSLLAGVPVSVLVEFLELKDFAPIVFCAIWTAYFLISKRVANTYPRFPQADDAGQVFE